MRNHLLISFVFLITACSCQNDSPTTPQPKDYSEKSNVHSEATDVNANDAAPGAGIPGSASPGSPGASDSGGRSPELSQ